MFNENVSAIQKEKALNKHGAVKVKELKNANAMVVNVSARNDDKDSSKRVKIEKTIVENEVSIKYVASCQMYSNHKMRPKGMAFVYNKWTRQLMWTGIAYQCDCGHCVIFKDDFGQGQILGYYFRKDVVPISNPSGWFIDPSEIEYSPYKYLPGYEFY